MSAEQVTRDYNHIYYMFLFGIRKYLLLLLRLLLLLL